MITPLLPILYHIVHIKVVLTTITPYTLLSEYIIDKQIFDNAFNNYERSEMREWLNNSFYNKSFSTLEKTRILTTIVDNSASTTISSSNPNACNNTNDKVYLLSYQEARSSTYGFTQNSARTSTTTDYARAIGVYMATDSKHYENGNWWLRSPYLFNEFYSNNIDDYGQLTTTSSTLPQLASGQLLE